MEFLTVASYIWLEANDANHIDCQITFNINIYNLYINKISNSDEYA